MNSDFGGIVAILSAQKVIRAQLAEGEPEEERPSRIRRAAAGLRRQVASIVTRARVTSERREVAQHPVSLGD
jgi:hypothetical protein